MRFLQAAAVCLFVIVVGLTLGTDAQDGAETACEVEAAAYKEDYLNRRFEGPTTRTDLLRQLRAFHRRHANAPICRQITRDYEVVLLFLDGHYSEADSVLIETLEDPTFERIPTQIQSRLIYNKGFITLRLGRLSDSAEFYYQAAALADRIPAHEAVRAYTSAADVARDLNDLPATVVYIEAAERILRDSTLAPEDARMDASGVYIQHASLAEVNAEAAYSSPARTAAYQAVRAYADSAYQVLRGGTQDGEVGRMALALLQRARAETQLGELEAAGQSFAQARPLLSQGITVFPDLNHRWWRDRTQLDLRAGDLEQALAASLQTEAEARKLGVASALKLYATLTQTGVVYERMGRLEEAEATYRQAIALAEVERDRIGFRDWTASSFADQQRPHRALARLLVKLHRPWEAFEIVDATRARTYRDLQATRRAEQTLSSDEFSHVSAILDSLAGVRVELATSPDAQTRVALTATIIALQDSAQAYLGVRPVHPPPLTQPDLQAALRPDQRVLISYLLSADEGLAFVMTPDTLSVVTLTSPPDSIRARSARLIAGWTRDVPDPAFRRETAMQLFEDLIDPLTALLPDGAPLTILPDATLAQLPFAALVRPGGVEPDYLVRQHPITTELAAGLMLDRPEASPARQVDLLAFGRSDFNGAPDLADLPFVPAEIRSIRTHAAHARTALDAKATESAFASEAASARVIHIASHAFVDPALPFNSRILLSASPDGETDGTLYLHELQNSRLDADLVVLSGCSTAQGQQHDGEGMIGLQYGVRVAGARAAVATLWPVDDRATVELMDAFYDGLADGLGKDRALQQAQLAYLDASDPRTASPFFWAGAVLSGDPAPVPLGGSRPGWALWLGLAALLGAIGLAWRLRSQIRPHD